MARILLIEDESVLAANMKAYLQNLGGYEVTHATNFEDAIASLTKPGHYYDIIITDHQYPAIEGGGIEDLGYKMIDVAKLKNIPVIWNSNEEKIDPKIALEKGASLAYTKPTPMKEVIAVIPEILSHQKSGRS